METYREFSTVVQLPGSPVPSIVTRTNAPEDNPDQATALTVECMRRMAAGDADSPEVWGATRQALAVPARGREQTCQAIYRWIASRVKFRSDDPFLSHVLGLDNELDLLMSPAQLLALRSPAEDCDGFTMLTCAMLLCAGVPCEIVTIKADPQDPKRFSHVYCQAHLEDGRAIVMDCSQGAQHGYPCGWEAPEYFARKTWGVMEPAPTNKGMHGLGDEDGGINWQSIIDQSFKFAGQLALKPGQYVQNREGVMASNVPGALPGQYPSTVGVNVGGISTGTILIGAVGLGLILALGRR